MNLTRNTARVRTVVATLNGDEMPGVLWIVDLCLQCGTMRSTEAEEWRRQILARLALLELTPASPCH